ncbi:MAG TPA: tRNA (adenosine(37)-N6)-threonylcarbamoyltransferase complex dimerization subunit type 1 TsaB [Pseudobdellovibrionaceae bacterium]|nr:tRNA (adenosine(37)-N6)-threonylcarbamoyltransferase complex dimerization subunit type 1 TsaB [Pseudobdellovibrionaceae bacterium]
MRVLALETSTRRGGAALIENGRVLAEVVTDQQRSHSELLHQFVEECLSQARTTLEQVDVFAVSRGPGSFTGIRVAGNAAKTYAYSFEKPLVALDSLTVLAAEVADESKPVLAVLNAFKNMVYYGIFQIRSGFPEPLHAPAAATVQEILPLLDRPMFVLGEGFDLYKNDFSSALDRLEFLSEASPYPRPSTLGRLAETEAKNGRVLSWNGFIPLYLRASEAEEKQRGSLFKPVIAKDRTDGKSR